MYFIFLNLTPFGVQPCQQSCREENDTVAAMNMDAHCTIRVTLNNINAVFK